MKEKNKDIHLFILSLIILFVISISLLGILKITGSYMAKNSDTEKEENLSINDNIKKTEVPLGDPLIVPASKVK